MKHDNADNVSPPENAQLLKTAAQFLDAETDAMDASTRSALAHARANAAEARRKQWLQMPWLIWGGAGVGAALAASLTALVILPAQNGTGTDAVVEKLLSAQAHVVENDTRGPDAYEESEINDDAFNETTFNEVALVDDADSAIADDLAFIAWLEENHDPS